MLIRLLTLSLLAMTVVGVPAKEISPAIKKQSIEYVSPIHFKMTLAGNFGEPRPKHFHGGIDVKTEHVEGKPIYSIAEGCIIKASVGVKGFGNALYVRHPDGHTSVYAHLRAFNPRVAAAVKSYQARHTEHDDTCEVTFSPWQFPVCQGQFIAFSGNTGASTGPHLHMEIHDTKSENMLDPLDFMKKFVDDNVPPMLLGLKAYPKKDEGFFVTSAVFYPNTMGLYAWGIVGFAIRAEDYMDSVPNRYGIRYTRLYADGKLVFSSDVNNIPVSDNPLVDVWADSLQYQRNRQWFLKSFIEPDNTLPILKADNNKGYVIFNEERPYHLRYVLSDVFGNTTRKDFVVWGRKRKLDK